MYTKKFQSYLQDINKIYTSKKPLFSVVIPLYNKEKYIKRAINSVLKQTFQNFEIIVVNDGSTDNSLPVVKKIKDKRIKIFDLKSNNGPHFTRNYGIKKSNGKYIAFLDADDEYKPFFLMTIVNLMFKYQDIKIYATSFKRVYNYASTERTFYGKKKDCIINKFISEIAKNKNFALQLSSTVVEKKLLLDTGLFYSPEKNKNIDVTTEDVDLFIRLSMHYDKLAYSNRICSIYYRNTKYSISKTASNKKYYFRFLEETLAKKKRMVKTKKEKALIDKLKYNFYESIGLQLIMKQNFALAEKVLKKIPVTIRNKKVVKLLKVQKTNYLLTKRIG